jgi:enoyl-CoA hydratase/carnithine racemase
LTSRAFTPAEAQEMGLVHRVVPDAISAARSWAEEIAVLAPLSVQGHKRAIQLVGAGQSLSEESRAEIAAIEAACFASEDLQEGLVAFNQKRPPQFRGV